MVSKIINIVNEMEGKQSKVMHKYHLKPSFKSKYKVDSNSVALHKHIHKMTYRKKCA